MTVAVEAQSLREKLAAEPDALFEAVAKEHAVSVRAAVEALPSSMRRIAPGEAFVAVMEDVAKWGDVTLIIHTDDGIMEFGGPVPQGKVAQGYYNLSGRFGFHGHLRHERCGGVAFVERPFFGRPSASILLFNIEGGVMFKIFVGRDEKREMIHEQLAAFRALADRLCEVA